MHQLPSRLLAAALTLAIVVYGFATTLPTRAAATYWVAPGGSDTSGNGSESSPFATINRALALAQPGATIRLKPGVYSQDVMTVRDGTSSAPITIAGPADAVLRGSGGAPRVVQINHDYTTLTGFTIDGRNGGSYAEWRDKLVYVIGNTPGGDVLGLKITYMTIKNGGGECLRMRYNTRGAEIAYNRIGPCGQHDFPGGVYAGAGKNGEGIYIGTAPEQLGQNGAPDAGPDASNNNRVHHNWFDTQGNECVDIKEGSSANIVEYNDCTGQRDPNSAGFDARGSGNTFRYNKSFGNVGAGIRFGGDTPADGVSNSAYYNSISNNQAGGIKFQATPQGTICGNTMAGNAGGDSVGSYGSQFSPAAGCPDSVAKPVGAVGAGGGGASPTPAPTSQPPATAVPTSPPAGALTIGGDTYVQAEGFTARYGAWRTVAGSSLTYVVVPQGQGASGDAQRQEYQLNVTSAGKYYVWLRLYGPDASSDSVYTRMDGGTRAALHCDPAKEGTWHWRRVASAFSLSAGQHTFTISNREDGTRVDKLFFTTSADARP